MYLVIFDCDGTLIDSQQTILQGLEVGFQTVGLPMPDRKTALSIVGLSLEQAFAALLDAEHHHLASRMADAYRAAKIERRKVGADLDPLYPGAREALDELAKHDDILLGIATGKARRGVDHMMDVHNLHGRFVTIQTADTSPSKPHPDMILQALSETGVAPENAVMIGDTTFDMEMALAAGINPLGVSWGYHEAEALKKVGNVNVIKHFDELSDSIFKLLKLNREPA